MILKSVRVENFKCIDDSNEFSIEEVTCLVGKNESGKTALLQALSKLKPDIQAKGNFDLLPDYPRRKYSEYKERHKTNPDNVLTTSWELEDKDINSLFDFLGCDPMKDKTIQVTKGYDNVSYWKIEIDEPRVIGLNFDSAGLSKEERANLANIKTIDQLIAELKANTSPSEAQKSLLVNLQKSLPTGDLRKEIVAKLSKQMPTFLYFDDYRKLPGQISVNDLIEKLNRKDLSLKESCFLALLGSVTYLL